MRTMRLDRLGWILGWAVLLAAGALLLVRVDIAQRRAAFRADAGVAYRLLSQRAAQHDAILATLGLLAPSSVGVELPQERLPAVYPQVLSVLQRARGQSWPDPALQRAETRSAASGHAELGPVDLPAGRFVLVQAATPSSFAMRIDVARMVPWGEWPVARAGPVRVALSLDGRTLELQPGLPVALQPLGLTAGFVFEQRLAPPSQPFVLQLRLATGPSQWPWGWLSAWLVCVSAVVLAALAWQRARRARRRADDVMRFGQVARLNAMGELAAGMAHELSQPLTAVVASAQAARRLLDDETPALELLRRAVAQVEAQGRRAADVVTRLRRQVEAPAAVGATRPVDLRASLDQVLELLEPELARAGVAVQVRGASVQVEADPVALVQILHNLLSNSLQALAEVPADERALLVEFGMAEGQALLRVRDTGPGIAPELLPRLFEPFFSTRRGGLGLGLSLCEALAHGMHGSLVARNAEPRGAEMRLALPLAGSTP